jgi:hypothetical protein
MQQAFPGHYAAECKTLADDVAHMKRVLADKYPPEKAP